MTTGQREEADVCKCNSLLGTGHLRRSVVAHFSAVDAARHNNGGMVETKLGHALHLDTKRAQDDKVEEGVDNGSEEAPHNNLADGTAARDLGNKHSHEGSPRYPPRPVKDGPPIDPGGVVRAIVLSRVGHGNASGLCHIVVDGVDPNTIFKPSLIPCVAAGAGLKLKRELFEGVSLKCNRDDVLEVVAERLHVNVDEVPGVVKVEEQKEQRVAQAEGDLRDSLETFVETDRNRAGGNECDDTDDTNLPIFALVAAIATGRDAAIANSASTTI
mmetsp:Transcript_36023/g.52868  ORF Transcript_36023/g.52868 Transcript_36023/m.52868 type:complete len:272 (+) Transcript_36023:1364-2179(+)